MISLILNTYFTNLGTPIGGVYYVAFYFEVAFLVDFEAIEMYNEIFVVPFTTDNVVLMDMVAKTK